ncbi:MAG: glycosyltransferase family 2 protein [Candidatus Thorarchaeota archaeon]
MTRESDTISVLIPAKNAGKTISRAINSVLSQTRLPDKIVVVNDQSTDNTMNLLLKYQKEYPELFVIVEGPGLGAGASRDAGIKAIETKYVAFLDSDDWYTPNALETLYPMVMRTGATSGAICKVYDNGVKRMQKLPSKSNILINHEMTKRAVYTSMSSSMFLTRLVRHVGGFNPKLIRMEDLDFHLRITKLVDYYFTPTLVAYYETPFGEDLQKKGFTYSKWEAIVWKQHGFFRWSEVFRTIKYSLINILLIPLNVFRKLRNPRVKLFNPLYLRMLLGYISGMMTKYPTPTNTG